VRVTVQHLAAVLQPLFTTEADGLARATGFVRRRRKVSGASFLQALVFGWLHDPHAPLDALADAAGHGGRRVTPQALGQRLTPAAAAFLKAVFAAATRRVVEAAPERIPLVRRFAGVYVEDCTTAALPAGLAGDFPGCGGAAPDQGRAALKLYVRLELAAGGLDHFAFGPGRGGDLWAARQAPVLPAGALRLADRGFFDFGVFRRDDAAGVFYLSRVPAHVRVNRPGEPPAKIARFLARLAGDDFDGRVELAGGAYACRLVARRCPPEVARRRQEKLRRDARHKGAKVSPGQLALCGWTVFVTNLPAGGYGFDVLRVLYRCRWQIECLFKRWKHWGRWGDSRGRTSDRFLCELYAKLIGLVVLHWAALLRGGPLGAASPVAAERRVRRAAERVRTALAAGSLLIAVLHHLCDTLWALPRRRRRRTRPSTRQLLFAATLAA
jgi:Transposase DDE domain